MLTEVVNVVELDSASHRMPGQNHLDQGPLSESQAQGRRERILVVDDHRAWLELAHRILSAGGYQIQVCQHSPEALLLLKENPGQIDLVITDLSMPCLDGIELAAEVLKINRALPVVLTSAEVVEMTPAELQTAGFQGFLPKPWEPKRLFSIVKQALASTRLPETKG
jgi:two-component system cell cycle sensor histidine kinase/response regulator CckA